MLYEAVFNLNELENIKKSQNIRTKELLKDVLASAENSITAGEGADLLNLGFAYYYTGEKITIPLDPTLTPQQNAKNKLIKQTNMI